MRRHYDVIVVGSGFGGAVMACRLAESGRSVGVLERGRRWDRSEFPRSLSQVATSAFWELGRSHGFLEYSAFRRVDVIHGAGVGGGSLHYFNVNVPAAAAIFTDPRWPSAVTRRSLDPYYDLALRELGSAPLAPPPGRHELPERTTAFVRAAQQAGYSAEPLPIAVYTGEPRVNLFSGLEDNPCTYCGNCLLGCDIGAKNTLDTNYLARAEHRHGAEIFPLHLVGSIEPRPSGGYTVSYRRLAEDPRGPSDPGTVDADVVVVAAGSLGSTQLLLACRDRYRTLPNLPSALGERFSVNGEYLLGFIRDAATRVDPGLGPPITARVTASPGDHLVTIEDLGLPDSLLWYLDGMLSLRERRLVDFARLVSSYLGAAFHPGRRPRPAVRLDDLFRNSATAWVMPLLGMGTDSSDGRMKLTGGSLDVDWSPARNRRLYREMTDVMNRIASGAGGRFVPSRLYRWPLRRVLNRPSARGMPDG